MDRRVRRVAPPQLDPGLAIEASQVAESLTGLAMFAREDLRQDCFDAGARWFDEVRTEASKDLRSAIAPFLESGATVRVWHALAALLADAPGDMPTFLRHLEAMPAEELWLQLLGLHERHEPPPELSAAILAAGRGRVDPLRRALAGDERRGGGWWVELAVGLGADAERAKRLVLGALPRWHDEVFAPRWPEIEPILARDAEEKRRLARAAPVAHVFEEATNGGEYVQEVGVDRLLLMPTYLCRPWVTISRQRSTLVVVYPVGEGALAGSAEEAERQRILRLARALSDDTRLRALRRLARSSCSLVELADELGVSKSTMHHHLAALRAAGLLRMRVGEKRYSLRTAPLSEVSALIGGYVGAAEKGRRR